MTTVAPDTQSAVLPTLPAKDEAPGIKRKSVQFGKAWKGELQTRLPLPAPGSPGRAAAEAVPPKPLAPGSVGSIFVRIKRVYNIAVSSSTGEWRGWECVGLVGPPAHVPPPLPCA